MLRSGRRWLLSVVPALVLGLAACAPRPTDSPQAATALAWSRPGDPTPPPQTEASAEGFLGSSACKPCHAAEFESHQHTRHSKTLYRALRSELADLAPPEGPIPGSGTLAWEGDQMVVVVPNKATGEPVPVPIDLALGSGKTGMSFLAVHDAGSLELRKSYFPHQGSWFFTPGMERYDPKVVAASLTVAETKKCIACHAVTVPKDALLPEQKFFGVGCESCHGPGKTHVAAMNHGEKLTPTSLATFRGAGGKKINAVCGTCHQTEASITRDKLSTTATNRFQPYGLAKSRCFTQSQDKLSCVTCHDPHKDASTDHRRYEKTCLSCHSAPKKACPVNPKEKCVACHMPQRAAFATATFSVKMADHFIRVNR